MKKEETRQQDTYYPPITIRTDYGIVNIYRPILTDEERERRMAEIKKSAASLLRSRKTEKEALPEVTDLNI